MNDFKKLKQFKPIPDYLTIKKSDIHGLGLFATEEIKEGVELGISHVKDDRFLHGYINKLSTKECLEKGTEMSSQIIQMIGARIK